MSAWMNEDDVRGAAERYRGHPVLGPATQTLVSLMDAVNGMSDGWPYWQRPRKASARLQDLIQAAYQADRGEGELSQQTAAHYLHMAHAQLRRFRTERPDCKFRIYSAPGAPGDPEPERPEPPQPERPVQHQIRIEVRGDRATITVTGGGPLPAGRYMGAVVKLSDRRGEAA